MSLENTTNTLNQALFNNHFGISNHIDSLHTALYKIQNLSAFLRESAACAQEANNKVDLSPEGLYAMADAIETHALDASLILESKQYQELIKSMQT